MSGKRESGRTAPGGPGAKAHWFSSRKDAVGTSPLPSRRIWFTIGEGVLDEIYYPRIDNPCTRDLELIVAGPDGFFSEERRETRHEVAWEQPGVPVFTVTNEHRDGVYRLRKEILTDLRHPVVLQRIRFESTRDDLDLFALLSAHLDNEREPNNAWTGEYKGVPMLFARAKGECLAFVSTSGWTERSVGYAGASDGRDDLRHYGSLIRRYETAPEGNVVLTGRISAPGETVLAIGFGGTPDEAAFHVRASLRRGFDVIRREVVEAWLEWQRSLSLPGALTSATILHCHGDGAGTCPGAVIASLSIPWGDGETGLDAGGYHLVWPRDACQAAGGLLAAGAISEAEAILDYFHITQEDDGRWPQRMWADGEAGHWSELQLDAVAAPLLLFDLLERHAGTPLTLHWPMLRRAAAFIAKNGPTTEQDRWERNGGFTPYTLATAVAALVVAGEAAGRMGEEELGRYLLETADAWNGQIDGWLFTTDSVLAQEAGAAGLHCRIVPATPEGRPNFDGPYPIRNHLDCPVARPRETTSPDALALVFLGLRRPDDPTITATLRILDATLRTETPRGPVWHRYNGDGYGEPPDGTPYAGKGIGRGWPLLTAERAHYEMIAGRIDEARKLVTALEAFGGKTGLIPEQVWDEADLPGRELFLGKATGSARPLVWAHAEHLKLLRSLRDGCSFAMPEAVRLRYALQGTRPRHTPWRFDLQTEKLLPGTALRIEVAAMATVRWSLDRWATSRDAVTVDTGIGLHYCDIDPQAATRVEFTFHWREADRWEERNFGIDSV